MSTQPIDSELIPPEPKSPERRDVAIVPAMPKRELLLSPVMDLATAKKRLGEFQLFVQEYLEEGDGADYGHIPGVTKMILFKAGAEKLCEIYGYSNRYVFERTVEDYEKKLFDYTIRCEILSRRDDSLVATGLGSCNSYESKYRWREQQRKCPNCGKETIIKGKSEYGGGWLCWAKKGGCGQKFPDGATAIESQTVGRVENEDLMDVKNTVLKMAAKRAFISATVAATRSSGIFTMDLEENGTVEAPAPKPAVPTLPNCYDCGNQIQSWKTQDGKTIPAELIAKKSKEGYGVTLCGDCAIKRHKAKVSGAAAQPTPTPQREAVELEPEEEAETRQMLCSVIAVTEPRQPDSPRSPLNVDVLDLARVDKRGSAPEVRLNCFDKRLWPELRELRNRRAMFRVEDRGKYLHLVGIEAAPKAVEIDDEDIPF